jgi:hypothetical protein
MIYFISLFILYLGLSILCASPLILLQVYNDIYIYYDLIFAHTANFNLLAGPWANNFELNLNWLIDITSN